MTLPPTNSDPQDPESAPAVEAPIMPAASTAVPTPPTPPTRRRRWPVIIAVGFFVLLILGAGGFVTASALEEHDTFCISCHTVPETTYFNRAYISVDNPNDPVMDLATDHYHLSKIHNKGDFSCISCHRGDASFGQRISTLALGGRDALIYVVGKEDPTIEKTSTREGWLPNAACTSCHTDTLLTLKGLDNHFHNHLPQAAAALANGGKLIVPDNLKDRQDVLLKTGLETVNTSLVCTSCHQAHSTLPNGAANFFMDSDRRIKACVTCHQDAKAGPQDVNSLK
ncbi:MAG: cytochrome c3 family protein [Chloroflexota bacterium]